MAVLNPRELKEAADRRIQEASFDPGKLILIHTGVIVALNLIVSGLNLYLSEQIGTTGGLSGLGLRSVLQTAQTVLSYFSTFFTPFWSAGLLFAMICVARGQEARPSALLQGFRRLGSVLSYTLLEMLFFVFAATILCYAVTYVYLLTPLASEVMALMEELVTNPEVFLSDGTLNLEAFPMDTIYPMLTPLMILYAVVTVPVVIFLSYQFRMGIFLLVEGIHRGAFGAFLVSAKLMKGHKWQMLKLDLSFWWYYLLEGVLTVVLYLDVILSAVGIALPFTPVIAFFVTIALHGLLQLALHWWVKARIDVTYATAYEAIYREVVPANPDEPALRKL